MRHRALGKRALVAFLTLVATAPGPAAACGHCIEDKIAATYDYAVLAAAAHRGHVVVFTEIRGPAAGAGPALATFVERSVAAIPGVDPGTVRVSLDPPAVSFACDPARHSPRQLVEQAGRRLMAKRLGLRLIKIDNGPRSMPRAAVGRRAARTPAT